MWASTGRKGKPETYNVPRVCRLDDSIIPQTSRRIQGGRLILDLGFQGGVLGGIPMKVISVRAL